MKVIVDLHALRVSQNGSPHSGSRDGFQEWSDSDIQETVAIIDFLASRLLLFSLNFQVQIFTFYQIRIGAIQFLSILYKFYSNCNIQTYIKFVRILTNCSS